MLSVVIFVAVITVILYKDRENVERQSILFLRKTQRGKNFIIKLGTSFPRFWKVVGTIGVVVGFFMSFYITYFITGITITNFTAKKPTSPLALILPSPSQETVAVPGVIGVPFWYWIISLALLIVVHEGLHGIIAASERVRIKSLGWGVLAVLPLAFVEPDEKQLEKKSTWTQLRVFAAGSFANFLLAGVVAVSFMVFFSNVFVAGGVAYRGVYADYPAAKANLTGVIVRIDSYNISTIHDLERALSEAGPEKNITIVTMIIKNDSREFKEFHLTTTHDPENQSRAFIGITGVSQYSEVRPEYAAYSGIIFFLNDLLAFIFLINVGVGAANLMPIGPLDGGRMWGIVLRKYAPKIEKPAIKAISYAMAMMLLLNIGFALFG